MLLSAFLHAEKLCHPLVYHLVTVPLIPSFLLRNTVLPTPPWLPYLPSFLECKDIQIWLVIKNKNWPKLPLLCSSLLLLPVILLSPPFKTKLLEKDSSFPFPTTYFIQSLIQINLNFVLFALKSTETACTCITKDLISQLPCLVGPSSTLSTCPISSFQISTL